MPGKDKPYRVYRGGRVKGPVKPIREERVESRRDGDGYRAAKPKVRGRRRWRRAILLLLLGLVVVTLVWALLGYLAVRRGLNEANGKLPESAKRALASPAGSILTNATNLLVLGTDVGGNRKDRTGPGRSDSIMLIRTDPDANRVAYLAIPRDLRVDIPGHGTDKINASYSLGGPALAIDTVEALTGLGVHHVVVFDLGSFKEVVDAVGGITIVNPEPVLSNRFDCPYPPKRCETWRGWYFPKGERHLNGSQALAYARIRKNQLDPSESDITRGERQQRVVQGVSDRVVSPIGFLRMPLMGDDLVSPLPTDLSAGELLSLGWVRSRAADSKTLRCRLGGDPVTVGGSIALQSTEDNALVIAMITGQTEAQRPPRGQPFRPGCFVGRAGE